MLAGIIVWAWFNRDQLTGLAAFRDGAKSNTVNIGAAVIGGPFTLVNQDGVTVTDRDFAGKYRLMFFGFTHCPDVCPTKLTALTEVVTLLGDKAHLVVPIFVTLDPERDTPDVLKGYVRAFSDTLVGLTGTADQIQAVVKNYRIYAQKTSSDTGYSIDHSAFSYLMGPKNEFIDVMPYDTSPEDMAAKVNQHLATH